MCSPAVVVDNPSPDEEGVAVCTAVAAKLNYFKQKHKESHQTELAPHCHLDQPKHSTSPALLSPQLPHHVSSSGHTSGASNDSKIQLSLEYHTPLSSFLLPEAPPPSPGDIDSEIPIPIAVEPAQESLNQPLRIHSPAVSTNKMAKAPFNVPPPPYPIPSLPTDVPSPSYPMSTQPTDILPPSYDYSMSTTPPMQSNLTVVPSAVPPPSYHYPVSTRPLLVSPLPSPAMYPAVLPLSSQPPPPIVVTPASNPQQNVAQNTNTNLTVVNTVSNNATTIMERPPSTYLVISLILTILYSVFNPLALICSCSALICSCLACYYNNIGDTSAARFHGRCAVVLDIISVVFGVMFVLLVVPVIIAVSVVVPSQLQAAAADLYQSPYY